MSASVLVGTAARRTLNVAEPIKTLHTSNTCLGNDFCFPQGAGPRRRNVNEPNMIAKKNNTFRTLVAHVSARAERPGTGKPRARFIPASAGSRGSTRRPRAAVQRLRRCIDDDDGGNEDDDYDDDDDDDDDDAHTTAPR
eukprot:9478667-Pyramimonas_sp.AAC.1